MNELIWLLTFKVTHVQIFFSDASWEIVIQHL